VKGRLVFAAIAVLGIGVLALVTTGAAAAWVLGDR